MNKWPPDYMREYTKRSNLLAACEADPSLKAALMMHYINLHRSNIIINYDLPWNPTRVLQRVGRVNRVGTQHDKVYVFNIFPTAQSDAHLGLEDNIKGKIQAFHNTLGEDAKYLSDDEELRAAI